MNSAPIGGRQSASSFVCVTSKCQIIGSSSVQKHDVLVVYLRVMYMMLADYEGSVSLFLRSFKYVFCHLHNFFISQKSHELTREPQTRVSSQYKCYHQSAAPKSANIE